MKTSRRLPEEMHPSSWGPTCHHSAGGPGGAEGGAEERGGGGEGEHGGAGGAGGSQVGGLSLVVCQLVCAPESRRGLHPLQALQEGL